MSYEGPFLFYLHQRTILSLFNCLLCWFFVFLWVLLSNSLLVFGFVVVCMGLNDLLGSLIHFNFQVTTKLKSIHNLNQIHQSHKNSRTTFGEAYQQKNMVTTIYLDKLIMPKIAAAKTINANMDNNMMAMKTLEILEKYGHNCGNLTIHNQMMTP